MELIMADRAGLPWAACCQAVLRGLGLRALALGMLVGSGDFEAGEAVERHAGCALEDRLVLLVQLLQQLLQAAKGEVANLKAPASMQAAS